MALGSSQPYGHFGSTDSPPVGGGPGSITQIASADGTITIANPFGAIVDLSVGLVDGRIPFGSTGNVFSEESLGPYYAHAASKWLALGTVAPNLSGYSASSRGMTFKAAGAEGGAVEFQTDASGSAHTVGSVDFWHGANQVIGIYVDNGVSSGGTGRMRFFVGNPLVQAWDFKPTFTATTIPCSFGSTIGQTAGSIFLTQAAQQTIDKILGTFKIGTSTAHAINLYANGVDVLGVDAAGGAASGRLTFQPGSGAAVAAAGTGGIRYNEGTGKMQYSANGGAWTDFT